MYTTGLKTVIQNLSSGDTAVMGNHTPQNVNHSNPGSGVLKQAWGEGYYGPQGKQSMSKPHRPLFPQILNFVSQHLCLKLLCES